MGKGLRRALAERSGRDKRRRRTSGGGSQSARSAYLLAVKDGLTDIEICQRDVLYQPSTPVSGVTRNPTAGHGIGIKDYRHDDRNFLPDRPNPTLDQRPCRPPPRRPSREACSLTGVGDNVPLDCLAKAL